MTIDDSGRRLAVSDGETVRVWDLGLQYVRSVIPAAGVTAMAFSTQGKELALATKSGPIRIWSTDFPLLEVRFASWLDRMTEEKSREIHLKYDPFQTVNPRRAPTSNGLVALALPDQTPKVMDEANNNLILNFENAKPCLSIAVSYDNRLAATGSYNNKTGMGDVSLWDLRTGRQLGEFDGHVHYAWSVVFSHDDTYLLTGGANTMYLWNVRTQKEVRRFTMPGSQVKRVAFSPDDRRAIASTGEGRMLRNYLFDVTTGEALLKFDGLPPEFVFDASASYSDQRFGAVRVLESQ
jgi:WD40 repeat protein